MPICRSIRLQVCEDSSLSHFPNYLLKTWNNGLTTGLSSFFIHINQGCTPGQSFLRTILGGADFPLSLSIASCTVTGLSIPGKTSLVLFYTFFEASESITSIIYFLGFHTRREIREIVSVIVRGSESSPLWSLPCVVNQKHFHYIIRFPMCARSSPSSPRQHLLPSKEGDARRFTCKSLPPLKVVLYSSTSGFSNKVLIRNHRGKRTSCLQRLFIMKPGTAILSGEENIALIAHVVKCVLSFSASIT